MDTIRREVSRFAKPFRSRTGYVAIIFILANWVGRIVGLLSDINFVADSGSSVWDFLVSTEGFVVLTIITLLLILAVYRRDLWRRENRPPPEPAFPETLDAIFVRPVFVLNGVAVTIQFTFTVEEQPHTLYLNGQNTGFPVLGGVGSFMVPWTIRAEARGSAIAANMSIKLLLDYPLTIPAGAALAHSDPDFDEATTHKASFNFRSIRVGYQSTPHPLPETKYGYFTFPGGSEFDVPASPVHWLRYRRAGQYWRGNDPNESITESAAEQ